MVHKKGKSKRQTLHQKYKIERKVREHNRKQRREARKNPKRTTLKKDPGIPNLHPFKEALLEKLTQQKLRAEEHAAEVRRRRKKLLEQKRKSGELGDEEEDVEMALQQKKKSVSELAREATERREEYEEVEASGVQAADGSRLVKETSRHAYFREFKKVVEASDVILEVLDARDPIGCRCTDVEDYIMRRDPNKRIVLVVNKIDLVPKDVAMQWLKYLRTQFPAIAFKCSTQKQRTNLRRAKVKASAASQRSLQKGSDCVGASHLIELLKNYSRNAKMKQALTVGIVGYPNVGKSSLINSLKRSKAVGVGATPGFTTVMQEVHLDKKIRLLDCPGIVFSSQETTDSGLVLRNCVKLEQLVDPLAPVDVILRRCRPEHLMRLYAIPTFDDSTQFLEEVAKRRGKFSKGVPDYQAAARIVLQDWNSGRIPFFTTPPAELPGVDKHTAEIVTQWSKEFDIDSITDFEAAAIEALPGVDITEATSMDSSTSRPSDMLSLDDVDGAEIPIATARAISRHDYAKPVAKSSASSLSTIDEDEDALNPKANQTRKKMLKMKRKERAKQERLLADAMAGCDGDGDASMGVSATTDDVDMMADEGDSDSDYDFAQDFGGF
eukprot:CAMPEP_0177656746 /NCGR_PEP_ID=MMETSP0447-20121125/15760_1 /TAXON_ID=0 /ORGANISM="Stygamoeba regulata, Strain BSH-02190019" /LENGTH=609 /DNA_ID=CAMNT_0019160943 /DNA_START=247 /DNA_END=2076 /DNA_ORIENTATION=-